MPDLNDLQTEYAELTRTIERQNELRDSGSDDYDWNKLDRTNNRRNEVKRAIEDSGGTPGGDQPPTDSPSGGPPADPAPPTPPDPGESTIDQLQRELGRLRDNPPHPGVRLEDGKVVGGTAEDFQEQLDWRGRVERLDHELTAAQADEAWAGTGGPDGFTDAEQTAIEQAGEKIDAIQERLDAVKSQIDEKNSLMDQARGQLDSQGTQGGGPNAAGGAAIAVGARIAGELRELHRQEAAIIQELNAALDALGAIVGGRVRTQLESSGLEVGLPNDEKGKAAVEDAFLRRVYRRLGLPYRARGASRLLRGLTGAQSRRLGRTPILALVAIVAIGLLTLYLLQGDDAATVGVADPEPVVSQTTVPDTSLAVEPSGDDAVVIPSEDVEVDDSEGSALDQTDPPLPPPPAIGVGIPFVCAQVVHLQLAGFADSLSYFMLSMLVGGVGGPIPDGTTLTVDAGGTAPNSAPINGFTAEVPIPIDHYGTYSVSSVTAEGPDGPLAVDYAIDDIVVGASEGPVGGCMTPAEAVAADPDFLGGYDGGLWFGGEPPAPSDSPTADPATPGFQAFLDGLDAAHQTGDVDALLGWLDPATIDRYGSDQCRGYLGQVAGSLADPTLVSATAEPWDYLTDGVSTNIPEAWSLLIDVTLGGSDQQVPMHVRPVDDQIYWFTDCGEPTG